MTNIPGLNLENLFLVFLSYFLVLLINRKTSSESAGLLLAILTFHHIVAYLYAFFLSTPPNESDHIGFVNLAAECTKSGYCGYFGQHLYANYLAKVFSLGLSLYSVFLLNIIFFVISLYYFIGISEVLNLNSYRRINIFLYSMWPSVIYFTTLNYREPFELYLLIAGIYFGLTGSKSDSFIRLLTSMVLLFLMGIFHIKGLTYLSPVLFLIVVSYRFSFTVYAVAQKVILLMLMSTAVYFSQGLYASFLADVSRSKSMQEVKVEKKKVDIAVTAEAATEKVEKKPLTGDRLIFEVNKNAWLKERNYPDAEPDFIDNFMRKVTFYRASLTWVNMPGTIFIGTISDKSLPAFIASYFLVYLEYLFSPFIFQVSSFLGLLAYSESVLRGLLFLSSLVLVKRHPQTGVLLLIYLAITAMWSIGVVSFGASIRHHIQTNWILILLGVPVILDFLRRRFFSSATE